MIDTTLSNNRIPFELELSAKDRDRMSKDELDAANDKKDSSEVEVREQLKLRKAITEYKKMWISLPMYGMTFCKFDVEDIEIKEWKKSSFLENPELNQYLESPEQYETWEQVTETRAVPGHRYVSVWDLLLDWQTKSCLI